jgi:hypothetical protein
MSDASKVTNACRQPRLNLRQPLLSPSDLRVQPLSPVLVHAHRNRQFVFVRLDLLPKLSPLALKGLPFVSGCWHRGMITQ